MRIDHIAELLNAEYLTKLPIDYGKAKINFMPERAIESETERYPTSERGMYSGLQKTIDEKVQGKFASPDQLKAIVTNPQNVKAEELKWSGVLGEIDRLAQENNGKVPKDKVMDYLRNEGAVKFEEVNLGGTTKTWTQDEIDALERQARRTRNWDAYEQAVLEFEDQQLGSDANQTGNLTKYAQYQLPGGENYREVVMTMPIDKKFLKQKEEEENRFQEVNKLLRQDGLTQEKRKILEKEKLNLLMSLSERSPSYTSSHFPDIANYVAHARVNDRVDAQGRKGRFIEEFQSDRHQAGREEGYKEDSKVLKEQRADGTWHVELPDGTPKNFYTESDANQYIASNNTGVIDAPFRKDWPLQIFKRQLRDAVDAGEEWIGWTTGIEQVRRYEDDLRKQVKSIEWTTKDGLTVVDVKPTNGKRIYLPVKDGKIYRTADQQSLVGKNLSEVIGKEATSKVIETPSGKLTGDDLTIGGEGMKGFYDQILPKEIGKYVAKMGGKVEKSEIATSKPDKKIDDLTDAELLQELARKGDTTPIWLVNITPEMAGKVRGGQLQFMPENFDAIKNADKSLLPLNEQPENQSISGRLTSRQKIAIDELEQYYKDKTPERIQKLKKDAEESLANRLVNIGIPVSDSKKIASKSFSDIKKMSSGAMQVISGMGMSDLSRMAGTGRPSVETRKGINPSWLTSAFESFETDDALALMKAQQVARQLTKSDQAKVAAGEKVESAKASGVRESTKEQGMSFVIGEKTADQKAFGSSLREDTDAPPRVYASVVEGQKFGSQGNYNLFFEWDKNTPMVITSHHHYGVGNGLTDIHASANIGDKNARSFGDVYNEKYDTLPRVTKVLDT